MKMRAMGPVLLIDGIENQVVEMDFSGHQALSDGSRDRAPLPFGARQGGAGLLTWLSLGRKGPLD